MKNLRPLCAKNEKSPIRINRTAALMPSEVRDLAVLLAEIAIQKLRLTEKSKKETK